MLLLIAEDGAKAVDFRPPIGCNLLRPGLSLLLYVSLCVVLTGDGTRVCQFLHRGTDFRTRDSYGFAGFLYTCSRRMPPMSVHSIVWRRVPLQSLLFVGWQFFFAPK